MDGLQTLQAIQQFNAARPPGEEIGAIMVSAFTRRAQKSPCAPYKQCFYFVTKPSGTSGEASLDRFSPGSGSENPVVYGPSQSPLGRATAGYRCGPWRRCTRLCLREPLRARETSAPSRSGCPRGGPRALGTLLPYPCSRVEVPILVVQHMPPDFTRSLAEHLTRQTGRVVVEARNRRYGRAADGLYRSGREASAAPRRCRGPPVRPGWSEQAPEAGCRPSANVLFRSAAAALGGDAVAILLTGMGNDGTAGLGPLKRAGGYVIAQDEETSVVWGMPGTAVEAGLVDTVLPLSEIAPAVQSLVPGNKTGSGSRRSLEKGRELRCGRVPVPVLFQDAGRWIWLRKLSTSFAVWYTGFAGW